MTNEEFRDRLDIIITKHEIDDENVTITNEKDYDAIRVAIKALEHTEPKEVFYRGDGYYDGELVYEFAECPECDFEYEESDHIWGLPFCPKCGQALKWEVENDK